MIVSLCEFFRGALDLTVVKGALDRCGNKERSEQSYEVRKVRVKKRFLFAKSATHRSQKIRSKHTLRFENGVNTVVRFPPSGYGEPYALLTASTIRDRLGTTWGLSETGAAGPTGNSYGDSAGHTCIAVAGPSVEHAETLETGLTDRVTNMDLFAEKALEVFEGVLLDAG